MLQRHALRVVVSELKNQTLKMRRKCFGDIWPEKKKTFGYVGSLYSRYLILSGFWGFFLDNFVFF